MNGPRFHRQRRIETKTERCERSLDLIFKLFGIVATSQRILDEDGSLKVLTWVKKLHLYRLALSLFSQLSQNLQNESLRRRLYGGEISFTELCFINLISLTKQA